MRTRIQNLLVVLTILVGIDHIAAQGNLVENGGFETGDFTDWTLVDDSNDTFVDDGSSSGIVPHSGSYLAALGPVGVLGYLSQTLNTVPGQSYLLSLWLNSPDGATPNEFLVNWGGNTIFDQSDIPAIGWTNLQYTVIATGASTVLQFGFRDDPSYLGLDDISVQPSGPISPTIQYTANPTSGGPSLTVQFNSPAVDSSGSNIVSWYWAFGDGDISTAQNPSHTYSTTGFFIPTLAATNNQDAAVLGVGPAITVTNPIVQFTATPTYGAPPLSVKFNSPGVDSLGNNISIWNWNFGDGSTSASQNPSHTYTTIGTFAPTLVATNNNGVAVLGLGPSITVNLPVQITTVSLPNGTAGVAYGFQLGASGGQTPYVWSLALNSASLPAGLFLDSSGLIRGTPTTEETSNIKVQVADAYGSSTNQSFSLKIIPPITYPIFSNGQFRFTLNNALGQFTIQFSTNLVDWVNLLATNLPTGSTMFGFSQPTNQDGFYRAFQSGLIVTDSWPGAIVTAPVLSFSNLSTYVDVPDSRAIISILRSGGLTNEVCVGYATSDGTARAGVDYTPVSGTLCFEPYQTNASITIPLLIRSNSPSSETVNFSLFNTNDAVELNDEVTMLFPQLLGTWYGNWAGTNGALICDGAILVPPPYGGGTWTLVMNQVDWPDRMAQGTLVMQGNEYARDTTNNCALCCLTELFPAYETSQIVSNIVVDSSGHVTIGISDSDLEHGDGFLVYVNPPGPDLGVDFEFDTFNEVTHGSFTSEYGSIVGGTNTDGSWSHVGWVSGERIAPTH